MRDSCCVYVEYGLNWEVSGQVSCINSGNHFQMFSLEIIMILELVYCFQMFYKLFNLTGLFTKVC